MGLSSIRAETPISWERGNGCQTRLAGAKVSSTTSTSARSISMFLLWPRIPAMPFVQDLARK
jgi:hypothetical protein